MGESTVENIQYKFELKNLKGNEVLCTNVNKTEIHSDQWVDDIDLFASTLNSESQEDKMDKNISYSILYGKDNEETKLIEENIDLYNDLVKIEEEERKAKEIVSYLK